MRTSFVRYVSPTPRHTSFRKERAIVGAARGRSASAIPDLELIHPGVSDLNRETPFGNSTRILSVVVAHLHCADRRALGSSVAPNIGVGREIGEQEVRNHGRVETRLLIRTAGVKWSVPGDRAWGSVGVLDPVLRAGARAYFGPRPSGWLRGPATRCLMGWSRWGKRCGRSIFLGRPRE